MTDVSEMLRVRQNKFVETRTRIEVEVNEFFKSINQIDNERIAAVPGKPNGTTCREVLSALWEEPFDEAKYNSQLAAFNAYKDGIIAVADSMNQEALQRLQS